MDARREPDDIDAYARHFEACGGTDLPYLRVHYPRYLRTQQRFLGRCSSPPGVLLDVGAHWLHQSLLYALRGFAVIALDVPTTFDDPHVRQLAERHAIRLLEDPVPDTATALATLPDDSVDVVLFTEIIEHLTFNPIAMWRQLYRVMKPGARIVVTTPNYYALRGRAWHWLRFLRGQGSGIDVGALLQQPTFAHHWKEYSMRELRRYFAMLSGDFACVDAAHLGKFGSTGAHRLLDAGARGIEWAVPVLRPNLYLHLALAQKSHGIAIEPHW